MWNWQHTIRRLSAEADFHERYEAAEIDLLRSLLAKTKAYNDELDATVYANNDWNSAPRADQHRIALSIELLEKGVEFVEPFLHHGIGFGKHGIVSPNKQRWLSYKTKAWYWYGTIDSLLAAVRGDKKVDVKALMLKKQKQHPENNFWKDEQAVIKWLASKA